MVFLWHSSDAPAPTQELSVCPLMTQAVLPQTNQSLEAASARGSGSTSPPNYMSASLNASLSFFVLPQTNKSLESERAFARKLGQQAAQTKEELQVGIATGMLDNLGGAQNGGRGQQTFRHGCWLSSSGYSCAWCLTCLRSG